MLKLGLTGGVASGKSTVAAIFKKHGARYLNTDWVAHDVVRPGTAAWKKVVRVFGKEILLKSQEIDRKKLSKIVFSRPEKLRQLEKIVHPAVVKKTRAWLAQRRKKKVCLAVVEVPLLYEAKMERLFDAVVAVTAPRRLQLKRGAEPARIRAQMSQREKARRADFTIVNAGSKKDLGKKVQKILNKLTTCE